MAFNNHPADNQTTVVTIDGPAGAGKSTVARKLAQALHFSYLDTGAMYRSLTLKAIRTKTDLNSEDALVKLAKSVVIDISADKEGIKIFLDGEDVSQAIRTVEVTNNTFYVARASRVREIMVEMQRAIARTKDVVVEGRDVGTVVFPHATKKFYLDAGINERTRRRIDELREKGNIVDSDKLAQELRERDHKDLTRKVGPLKKAEDACFIDSTHLSVDKVVEKMLTIIKENG